MFNTTEPAHNKKYRTQEAETTPAGRTRAYTQLTRMENKTHKGQSSQVETIIAQLENNFRQYLAVVDTDTGKLLNYRKLLINPKYKKNWSTSSENKFGRLTNGVGGRINIPTNTITFIMRK